MIRLSKYICPYCETTFSLSGATYSQYRPDFEYPNNANRGYYTEAGERIIPESEIEINFYHCPECSKYSIDLKGCGIETKSINFRALPFGHSKELPNYIPQAIRNDYKEASLIKTLSPKASATLSRRCLQGMIRDYWDISKGTLYKEIDAIKDKVTAQQWSVLDAVRKIGNIGAHMEKDINVIVDIDPDEAEKLIKLIEYLIKEWYINRHETEQLFADILKIDSDKAAAKLSK